jgi:hypothetical protein
MATLRLEIGRELLTVNEDHALAIVETVQCRSELERFILGHDEAHVGRSVRGAEIDLNLSVRQRFYDNGTDHPNRLISVE